ncbi:MAG TPA: HigA family addiction module antitoxin [Bryobacteraceae bacterium]
MPTRSKLSITTEKLLPPVSPGEVLLEEFMKPTGLSANRLAKAIGVPVSRVLGILNGTRGITADTAMRFSLYFGTTPQVWMNMQAHYDLELVRRQKLAIMKKVVSQEWRKEHGVKVAV